ncbi:MAG: methyltransferase domain-containing protein [Bryobacteraceae bacterium]
MDARLQLRIQRYGWDRACEDYESGWARQVEPAQRRLLEMAALRPGERVLDVACGTGLVTFPAASAVGKSGEVIGADISERMVEHASAEAARAGMGNVRFVRAGAEEMDFPEASFDAILCSLGLMYVPDPMAALQAMRTMLRPGGRLVAAVWGERARCGWAGIFPVVEARVESEVCPMFFQLGTGRNLGTALEQTGFGRVELDRIRTVLDYATADEAVGAAFVGGPVAMAYSRFSEEIREQARVAYLDTIAAYRQAGQGYALPGEFVVAAGWN